MGLRAAMEHIASILDDIDMTLKVEPDIAFRQIDGDGVHTPLDLASINQDRVFDIGTASIPVDDGESGSPVGGTGRLTVDLVVRVGYSKPASVDKRLLDAQVGEDSHTIITNLMNPFLWDCAGTGIMGIEFESEPVADNTDEGALIVSYPMTLIYREV